MSLDDCKKKMFLVSVTPTEEHGEFGKKVIR